jgi:hypothetical protein
VSVSSEVTTSTSGVITSRIFMDILPSIPVAQGLFGQHSRDNRVPLLRKRRRRERKGGFIAKRTEEKPATCGVVFGQVTVGLGIMTGTDCCHKSTSRGGNYEQDAGCR